MLKGGLVYADAITTVSNTYAEEIKTPFYGEGLDGLMRARSGDLRGIVNGIDYDVFNPETDPHIFQNYNAKISESSHYYITDYYRALANQDPEVCKMLIDGKIYDVQWIDDPMGMHEHLEIYLKAVGGVGSGTD